MAIRFLNGQNVTGSITVSGNTSVPAVIIANSLVSQTAPTTQLLFDNNNIDNSGGYNIDFKSSSNDTANRFMSRIQALRTTAAKSSLGFFTESGSALTRALLLDDSQNATFAGKVQFTSSSDYIDVISSDLYVVAAGKNILYSGNAEALRLDSSQNATFKGNVEIRTGNKLILQRPNNGVATEIHTDAAGTMILNSVNDEGFKFQNAGTTFLTLDTSDNATFTGNIDVNGTQITVGTNSSIFAENNLRFKSAGAAFIDHNTVSQSIKFRLSNSSSLDVIPLEITPSYSVFASVPFVGTMAVGDNTTRAASTAFVTAAVAAGGGTGGPFLPLTAGSTKPLTGDLYLKTTNDANIAREQIKWQTSQGTNRSFIRVGGSYADNALEFGTGNAILGMILHANGGLSIGTTVATTLPPASGLLVQGNVGVGTTSPSAKLDVFSAASFRADVATGNPLISIVNNTAIVNTAGTATIKFTQGNTQAGGKIVSGRDGNYSSGATRTSNLQFYTSTAATDTEKMRIHSSGNVSIGNTLNINKLDVSGNINIQGGNGSYLTFNNGDANIVINNNGTGTGRDLSFKTYSGSSNAERMRIDKDGNVGIGATRGYGFHDLSNYTYTANTGRLSLVSNGAEAVSIDSSQNVGIGATSPEKKLHIKGTTSNSTPQVLVQNASTGDASMLLNVSGQSYVFGIDYDDSKKFKIASSGNLGTTDRITLLSTGNVGIGTITPGYKLEVAGTARITSALTLGGNVNNRIEGTASSLDFKSNGEYYFRKGATTNLTILSGGNVGIGVTNPTLGKLQVGGIIHVNRSASNGTAANPIFENILQSGLNLTNLSSVQLGNSFGSDNGTFLRFQVNSTAAASTPLNILTLKGTGGVTLGTYTGSAQTGTPTYILGTDASGNVVKVLGSAIPGVPGGSGTLNTIPLWTPDGDTLGNSIITQPTSAEVRVAGTLKVSSTVTGYPSTKIQTGGFGDSQSGINILNSTTGYGYILFGDGSGASLYRGQIAYKHGDDFMAFNTAGSQRMTINSSGNVGIGTTTPAKKLDVVGNGRFEANSDALVVTSSDSNAPYIAWKNAGTSTGFIGSGYHLWSSPNNIAANFGIRAQTRLDLGIQASVHMTILNSGNVGIGTNAPSNKLVVKSGTGVDLEFGSEATSTFIQSYNRTSSAYGDLRFVTSGETMRLTNTGNVGINNTSPQAKLQVETTAALNTAIFENSGQTYSYTAIKVNEALNNKACLTFAVGDALASTDIIGEISGLVTNPDSQLKGAITFKTNQGDNLTERMRILANGNVGIGTTSPDNRLDVVASNVNITPNVESSAVFRRNGNNYLTILSNASNEGGILFGNAVDDNDGSLSYKHNTQSMQFSTADNERMRIDSSGNVFVGTDAVVQGDHKLVIKNASTVGTVNSHLALIGDSATIGQGAQILFSESGDGQAFAGGTISFARTGSNSMGNLLFGTRASGGDATTTTTTALTLDSSQNATFAADVNITQTTDVGVLNTTNLDNGSAVGLSLTYPTSNVAAGDGLAIAIGIAGRGRSYIANSNTTTNLDASNLAFYTESGGVIGERMIINQDGNVGIGTASPKAALHVAGAFNTNAPTGNGVLMGFYNSTHGYIQLNGPSGGYIDFSTSGTDHKGRLLYDNASNYMRFDTNGSERMRITEAGTVLINASAPTQTYGTGTPIKLSVQDGMSEFETTLTNGNDWANSPISILERGNIGSGSADDKYSPNLNFHWSGRVSNSLWMSDNGHLNWGSYTSGGVPAADGVFRTQEIYLIGTGRITGVDTVSASTDAANKAYVDAHVSPAGTYLPLAGGRMTGTAKIEFNNAAQYIHAISVNDLDIVAGDDINYRSNFSRFFSGSVEHARLSGLTNQNNWIALTSSTKLGVGTTSPLAKLDISTSGNTAIPALDALPGASTSAIFRNSGNTVILATGVNNANTSWLQGRQTTGTGNAFNIALNPLGGDVGIGTSSPGAKLEVRSNGSASAGAEIRLQHANNNTNDVVSTVNFANNAGSVGMIQAGTAGANNTGYIALFTDIAGSSSERMRVHTNGNVGIGTTSPTQKLEVHNTIKIGQTGVAGGRLISGDSMIFQIDSDDTSNTSSYRFRCDGTADDGTELMRIQEDGNVGIGTNDPSSFNSRGKNLVVNSNGDTGITISANTTSSSTLLFADAFAGTGGTAAYRGSIEYDHADDSMAFSTATLEVLSLNSDKSATFTGKVNGARATSNSAGDFAFSLGANDTGIRQDTSGGFNVDLFKSGTGYVNRLNINSDGNSTFTGKATSLATAASDGSTTLTTKSYVDGLVTGVPVYKGTWAAGTTGVTSAAINGTTITLTAAPAETIAIGDVVTADGITAAITVTAVGSQTSVTVNASVTIANSVTVTFSPSGGYPNLTLAANKVLGNYYIVSTAGSAAPNGAGIEPDSWAVGDWCIFSDVTPGAGTDLWQRIDNSSVVSGSGTGQKVTKWEGATNAVSETLTDGPITFNGNNSTFTATSSALTVIARDNLFVDAGQLFIGADNGSTDNVYRQTVSISGGTFKLQKRISGTYTDVLDFDNSLNATFAGNITLKGGGTIEAPSVGGNENLTLKAAGGINVIIDSNGNSGDDQYFKVIKHTSSELFSVKETGNAIFAGKATSASTVSTDAATTLVTKNYVDSSAGNPSHFRQGHKSHNLTNAFTTCLTVNLSNHTGCYVTVCCFGDWGSHSSAAYRGEFFLQNGANAYNEPGIILRQDDNTGGNSSGTSSDQIVCQILDPASTANPKNFEIQIRTTATTGGSFTGLITFTVQGKFNSVT